MQRTSRDLQTKPMLSRRTQNELTNTSQTDLFDQMTHSLPIDGVLLAMLEASQKLSKCRVQAL